MKSPACWGRAYCPGIAGICGFPRCIVGIWGITGPLTAGIWVLRGAWILEPRHHRRRLRGTATEMIWPGDSRRDRTPIAAGRGFLLGRACRDAWEVLDLHRLLLLRLPAPPSDVPQPRCSRSLGGCRSTHHLLGVGILAKSHLEGQALQLDDRIRVRLLRRLQKAHVSRGVPAVVAAVEVLVARDHGRRRCCECR